MVSHFFRNNKYLWNIILDHEGNDQDDDKLVKPSVVLKLIEEAFESDAVIWEFHFFSKAPIPYFLIKTSKNLWVFLRTDREAQEFKREMALNKNYVGCH